MINTTFNLRDAKANNETPINCKIRFSGNTITLATKQKVLPTNWSTKKGKVNSKNPIATEINAFLDKIKTTSSKEYTNYIDLNQNEPTPQELKRIIESEIFGNKNNQKEPLPKDLFTYFEYFENSQRKSTNKKSGKKISKATLNAYRNTALKLKEFETNTRYELTFESIDLDFYYKFVEYLENQNYQFNTIGKYIKNIKAVLNDATANGINKNQKYKSSKFVVLQEQTTEIYLDNEQIEDLDNLDLSNEPRLDKAKDLFLILCYTGQRYQSLEDLINPKNRINGNIEIKQEKTGKEIQIPILPPLQKIFDKYDKIETLSNPRLNLYIKEICQKLPSFANMVDVQSTKGGKEISVKRPFYSLVCTHSGRRSFCTNFYNMKYPIGLIMAITGHTKESTFLNYIRATPTENAQRFKEMYHSNLSKQVLKVS
jgi:integrase